MSTEVIPIDLIDHILSFLQSDIGTLQVCAKSHPILSDLSERYIYVDVVLLDDNHISTTPSIRTSEFTQILAKKPAIANHVRTLDMFCVSRHPGTGEDGVMTSHLDGVASILPMLTGLTRLTIMGSFSGVRFSWHAMPEKFCQAFLHLRFRDIVIRNISFFPMSLFNDRDNVRVSLEYCYGTRYATDPEVALRSYPVPFEHLSVIHCTEGRLEDIAVWIKFHPLRSLRWESLWFGDIFRQVLVACSNSLTNLYLDYSRDESVNSAYHTSSDLEIRRMNHANIAHLPFTLADLHHLTQLTMYTNSNLLSSTESWTLYSPIPSVLLVISTAYPTLKKLSIISKFSFRGSGLEYLPDPTVIWFPFIPLAARCSSSSISMYIHPSFVMLNDSPAKPAPNFWSPLADYKGLTPYVQSGAVVISEDFLKA